MYVSNDHGGGIDGLDGLGHRLDVVLHAASALGHVGAVLAVLHVHLVRLREEASTTFTVGLSSD